MTGPSRRVGFPPTAYTGEGPCQLSRVDRPAGPIAEAPPGETTGSILARGTTPPTQRGLPPGRAPTRPFFSCASFSRALDRSTAIIRCQASVSPLSKQNEKFLFQQSRYLVHCSDVASAVDWRPNILDILNPASFSGRSGLLEAVESCSSRLASYEILKVTVNRRNGLPSACRDDLVSVA